MYIPPFISRIAPVMKLASRLAKKHTADAVSLGVPSLPRGILPIRRFSVSSEYWFPIDVIVVPGHTTFTVIFSGAS